MTHDLVEDEEDRPFVTYLAELRHRLVVCALSLLVVFGVLCFYSKSLYHWVAIPLLNQLMGEQHFIATQVVTPFVSPLKLAFTLSIWLSIPIIFYQIWAFVTPALYKREKKLVWPLLFMSTSLFYAGMLFAYFVVFPLVFRFFTHLLPADISLMPDMAQYLEFVLTMLFAFGIAFQVPVITILLLRSKVMSKNQLRAARPYVIVMAFVLGMLLTPPDVISQIMLALPIWFLFEMGLWLG